MNMHQIIKAAFFTPMRKGYWGAPIFFWGRPGVAKTQMIQEFAKSLNIHCEHLTPGERGEGAFGVTPVPSEDMSVMTYPAPEWTRNLLQDGEEVGIVFVDEANTAPPALQPALLGMIQERRIGGHQCGPRVRLFGAGNPTEMSAGGWEFAPPVNNRFGHVEWSNPTLDSWVDWLEGTNQVLKTTDLRSHEQHVMDNWKTFYQEACRDVSAFLRSRPSLLFNQTDDRAWCSPRTWDMGISILASSRLHNLDVDHQRLLLGAFVGKGAAGEFGVWLEECDLPDCMAVLTGKEKWKPDSKRPDITDAVLTGCTNLVLDMERSQAESMSKKLWSIMEGVKDLDVVFRPVKRLVEENLHFTGGKAAKKVLDKLSGMLEVAGL